GVRAGRRAGGSRRCGDRRYSALRPSYPPQPVVSAADVVTGALDALKAREWDAFARCLHPDVVHRTPGVPEPILGRDAFLLLSQQAVARTHDVAFEVARLVSNDETAGVIG